MKLALAVVLSIVHVMHGCHVWGSKDAHPFGATKSLTLRAGAHVKVEIVCPMDFDIAQVAGPEISLGDPRWRTGTAHTLVFTKRGVYRLTATNVQTPEERGLETLGPVNTPRLIVRVR